MTVKPDSGIILETVFNLELTQWVDDASDLPLVYGYSFIEGEAGYDEQGLASNLQSNRYSTPLAGSPDNTVQLIGYVYDRFGSSARVPQSVTVKPKDFGSASEQFDYVMNQTDAMLGAALEGGDISEISNLVNTLAFILNDATEDTPV